MEENSEYYSRLLRIKPVIEASADVLEKIALAFEYEYHNQHNLLSTPDELLNLGKGNDHVVYGVGSIENPDNNEEMFIALSLRHNRHRRGPYLNKLADISFLIEKIGAFEYAFCSGIKTPYFAGVVTKPSICTDDIFAGLITEDISKGKNLQLSESSWDNSFCTRSNEDGSTERIFIDPGLGDESMEKWKYKEGEARIDLQK